MTIKILRIITRLNIGGPARNAVLLTEGFSVRRSALVECGKASFETILVCGEVERDEGDMMYLAEQKSIKPIVIKELGRELSWIDDLVAFWKIYRIIKHEKPQILHTHTAKAGALGRLAGILYNLTKLSIRPLIQSDSQKEIPPRLNTLRMVHTFHGHVFKGYFGRYKTEFYVMAERILGLFTDKIVTVSETLKKELVEKFHIASKNKVSVIELGFELGDLLGLPMRGKTETVNIGIIGRLAPIKNHKMIFRVLKYMIDTSQNIWNTNTKSIHRLPSDIAKLYIIGDGDMRRELSRYAKAIMINEMVEFRGWEKDLRAIYEDLDIVVLTSLNEGTPVSLIEAMARGLPVVATKVGGVPDLISDGKCGYLIESENEKAFGQKLLALVKDPAKRTRFGEYGRNIAISRFSKERLIMDTEKLYKYLVLNRAEDAAIKRTMNKNN